MEEGVVSEEQIRHALAEQRRTGELLGQTLVRLGFASEDDIAGTIVIQFGLPFMPVKKYSIKADLLKIFPPGLLRQYQFLPVEKMGRVLAVVAGGLLTPDILAEIEQLAGMRVLVYVGRQSDVREVIESKFVSAWKVPAEEEKKSLSMLGSMLLGEG